MPEPSNLYPQLKREIKSAHLLERNPGAYTGKFALTAALMAVCITLLAMSDNTWVQIGNAALMAFATVQLSFLGHDAGHRQIFRSRINNDRLGLVISAVVGINRTWWVQKHNLHHANPNDLDDDPDVNLPLIAFSESQLVQRGSALRALARHQASLFYPMTCFEGLILKISGIPHVVTGKSRYRILEPAALIIHVTAYATMLALCLPLWEAIAFAAVHHALTGLYISATFAPNHKGMPTTDRSSKPDFLRKQVMTSRNIRPGRLNDLLYGGLNYQIEHHLFPSMPRHNLHRARTLVRDFCRSNGVPYHETGPVRAQREILQHLHAVAESLREWPQQGENAKRKGETA